MIVFQSIFILVCSVSVMYLSIIIGRYIDNLKRFTNLPKNYTYNIMHEELKTYALSIITRSVLELVLFSERDHTGTRTVFKKISSPIEPEFQGIIVKVIGSMSPHLKSRFMIYFSSNSDIINEVSNILESYTMKIIERMKMLEGDVRKINTDAVRNEMSPIDEDSFIYGKLTILISDDCKRIDSLEEVGA